MIRINLLGTPKPKNKRSRVAIAAPTMDLGEVGSPAMKILVAIVLAGGVNAAYWYQLDHQSVAIAAKMKVAEQQNRELAVIHERGYAPRGKNFPAARPCRPRWELSPRR